MSLPRGPFDLVLIDEATGRPHVLRGVVLDDPDPAPTNDDSTCDHGACMYLRAKTAQMTLRSGPEHLPRAFGGDRP